MYKFVIDFIGISEEPLFTRIEFLGEKLRISKGDTLTFEKGEDFFEGNESKLVPLKMFTRKEAFDFVINYFKDYNHAYCFIDEIGTSYELIFFKSEPTDIRVRGYNTDIKIYDTNKTQTRKRYLLINYCLNTIEINGQNMHIIKYIHHIYKSIDISNSYQLSIYDLNKAYIIGRQITLPMNLEGMKNVFNIHYNFFLQFYNDFANALETEKEFKFRFNKLFQTYKNDDIPKYFLNRNKIGLEDDAYKEMYIDFTYYIILFLIYKEIMIFIINFSTARKFFEFIEVKFKQIKLDDSLKISEKIFIIEQFHKILKKVKTLDNFTKSGIAYYDMSKKEQNSILDLVQKYFYEYNKNITEENNRLFFRLIEVDNGIGFYNDKKFYGYGMQNLEELKDNLNRIFNSLLIIYKFKNKIFVLIQNKTGTINVYIKDIKELDKYKLDKTLSKEEFDEGKNIAAKIVVGFLHEAYGYKKFLINKLEYIPHFSNYVETERNKTNPNFDILIDGKDVEVFNKLMYAKIGEYTVCEVIEKINRYSDFLDEYTFFQNNFKDFLEYFTYKFLMHKLNKQLNEIPLDIRDKIQIVKNEITKNKLDIEPFIKKEIRVTGKKRRRPKNEGEDNGYEENIEYKDEDENYPTNKENDIRLGNIQNGINNSNKDLINYKENNNGQEYDFKNMSYDELIKLEQSGILKGDDLINCQMRLMQHEILDANDII